MSEKCQSTVFQDFFYNFFSKSSIYFSMTGKFVNDFPGFPGCVGTLVGLVLVIVVTSLFFQLIDPEAEGPDTFSLV